MAKSFLNYPGYPKGLRNNNPGNIRTGDNWQGMIGTNGGFVVFENIAWGLRAMGKAIIHELNIGNNTIAKLIYDYAPPQDGNDTEAYIKTVSSYTGYSRSQVLQPTKNTLKKLMRAMMNVELGNYYSGLITDADIYEGLSLIQTGIIAPEFRFEGIVLVGAALAIALSAKTTA